MLHNYALSASCVLSRDLNPSLPSLSNAILYPVGSPPVGSGCRQPLLRLAKMNSRFLNMNIIIRIISLLSQQYFS